jgi:hypothetical protein
MAKSHQNLEKELRSDTGHRVPDRNGPLRIAKSGGHRRYLPVYLDTQNREGCHQILPRVGQRYYLINVALFF